MRVLLLSCYELGHQPLGLAAPMGALRRGGHEVRALDLSLECLDEAAVRGADLVAISVPMHTALRLGLRAARHVRALHPSCHLAFHGLYAELNAKMLLAEVADSILGDDSADALVELAGALAGGNGAGPAVRPTLLLRKRGGYAPSREGLAGLARYAKAVIDGEERLAAYVEGSRGCLHHCRHCPIPPVYGGRFFINDEAQVLADIDQQVAAGARHVTFGDPDFLNGPGHALRLAQGLAMRHPGITFDVTAKIEHLLRHQALLPSFAEAGCVFVVSAVESLTDEVLMRLDKGHGRADVQLALELLRAAGIALRPSLVSFTPWTTLEDYLDVLDWVDGEGLWEHIDPVQYTIRLLLPPSSLLLGEPTLAPHLGALDAAGFSHAWKHPDSRMDALYDASLHVVKSGLAAGEPNRAIVARLRKAAHALNGGLLRSAPSAKHESNAPVPHLTEPWFCCAEPQDEPV